ncbi:MAG: hypothetical protein Tsb0018_00950 [Opitutales bacterium]
MISKKPIKALRRGFTLIEVVLAIGIGSFLMMSATFFLFSLTQLYINTQTDPLFDEHINNVHNFLRYTFQTAAPPSDSKQSSSSSSKESTPALTSPQKYTKKTESKNGSSPNRITWAKPDALDTLSDSLLSFKLNERIPFLVWEDGPLPSVTAYLYFTQELGLCLLWQTKDQQNEDKIERTLISALVKKIEYEYYDNDNNKWEKSETPLEASSGELRMPVALTLTFSDHGLEKTARIGLPFSSSSNALIY